MKGFDTRSIIEDRRFQETLDKIRKEEGYDFAAIAYESNKPSSPIKWHYVSGNKIIGLN